jgi:hypothetical protein
MTLLVMPTHKESTTLRFHFTKFERNSCSGMYRVTTGHASTKTETYFTALFALASTHGKVVGSILGGGMAIYTSMRG